MFAETEAVVRRSFHELCNERRFLWQNVTGHGKTARAYGEFANDYSGPSGSVSGWVDPTVWHDFCHDARLMAGQEPGPLRTPIGTYSAHADVPSLQRILSPTYPPFNTVSIPDQYRVQMWLREFRSYEAAGNLPSFNLFTLPQDHTGGTVPGFPTPAATVADNDLALGKMVDAISHSPDWKDSVIFVTEDDAQSGLDHVDGHRTTGFVISPYTRPGVNSTSYSQIDMVRTIEQILGLPPMNQFDAAAQPMYDAFTSTPNDQPFNRVPNQVPLDQTTPSSPPAAAAADVRTGAVRSGAVRTAELRAAWDAWAERTFEGHRFRPDGANDQALNRDIWYSTRGFATRWAPGREGRVSHSAPRRAWGHRGPTRAVERAQADATGDGRSPEPSETPAVPWGRPRRSPFVLTPRRWKRRACCRAADAVLAESVRA